MANPNPSPTTRFKKGKNGNPLGIQNTKALTRDGYALVVKLASLDKSESTILHALGISGPTWCAMKRRDPKLVEALEYGRGLARDSYVAALQRHGKKNFVPYVFLLKGLHGVTEGAPPETARTNIVITIPNATSLVDYRPPKLIEHE
ncbi:MAG: hypothetical protein ACYC9Z_18650 [Casimicrobiaceae bacterium]